MRTGGVQHEAVPCSTSHSDDRLPVRLPCGVEMGTVLRQRPVSEHAPRPDRSRPGRTPATDTMKAGAMSRTFAEPQEFAQNVFEMQS